MLCVKHFRIGTEATETDTELAQTGDTRFFFFLSFYQKSYFPFSMYISTIYPLKESKQKGQGLFTLPHVSLTMPPGFKINSPQDGASELHSLLLFLDLFLNKHTRCNWKYSSDKPQSYWLLLSVLYILKNIQYPNIQSATTVDIMTSHTIIRFALLLVLILPIQCISTLLRFSTQHIYLSRQCGFFLHHHLNNSSLCSPSIPYFETSAVTGVDVDQAVTTLLGLVMKRMEHSAYGGPGPEPNGSPVTSHEIEEAPVRRRCACWSRPRSSSTSHISQVPCQVTL